jgi:acyl phosphate:glycerol-3-phosphate acyltransferase
MIYQVLFLAVTYLICAIPFGLLLSKIFAGHDIRNSGSGNIGATNVARILGKKLGALTLVLDAAKGAVMVFVARQIFAEQHEFVALVAAIAVIGHIFPAYLRFKGGKGVATTVGVLLVFDPLLGALACCAWLLMFVVTRISALASLFAIICVAAFAIILFYPLADILLYLTFALLIFWRHRENLQRLINDQESKF